jgi:AraC-like DNA-binding protein/ligand-binding sensor protein
MAKHTSSVFPVEVSREIETSLLAFSSITGLPVTFYDEKCQVRSEYGSQYKICKFLRIYNREDSVCRHHLQSALRTAASLGEPYFFVCAAGFVNVAVPLIHDGTDYGCFIAGPIIMEKFSPRTISKLLALNLSGETAVSDKDMEHHADFLSRVVAILRDMYVYSSKQVAHLAILLNNSIVANLPDKSDYDRANARYREQVQIGDDLRGLKRSGKETGYPLEEEARLLGEVRAGRLAEAADAMAAYLNGILLYEAGNLDMAKVHLIELCALISRESPDLSEGSEAPIRDSFAYIETLNKADSIRDLKEWSESLVEHFSTRARVPGYTGSSPLILKALRLLAGEGGLRLTLTELSGQLHVNSSYLSAHFKKEMGTGFAEYVTAQKIRQSKDLLEKTNLRLLEIADLCGFEDQSYFTKVFTRQVGVSPREYRKSTGTSRPYSDR